MINLVLSIFIISILVVYNLKIQNKEFCLHMLCTKFKLILSDRKHKMILNKTIEVDTNFNVRRSKWFMRGLMVHFYPKIDQNYKRYSLVFEMDINYKKFKNVISNSKSAYRLSFEHFKTEMSAKEILEVKYLKSITTDLKASYM